MSLENEEWNITTYCDQIKIKKEHINAIDPKVYTDNILVGDLFKQLKTAPIEVFATKYKRLEIDWIMGKLIILETLINDALLR